MGEGSIFIENNDNQIAVQAANTCMKMEKLNGL